MRPTHKARGLATALLGATLAACSSGDPTYYRLATWPGTAVAGFAPAAVEVRSPTVAAYLDRDYIVERVSDYRLHLAGNDAWAETIGDMIGRTIASDVASRLPASRVFVEGSTAGARDADRIDLDIARFDRDADGTVVLRGLLTVRDPTGAPLRSETLDLADRGAGSGTAAFVAAESRLLGQVADRAAAVLATTAPAPMPLAAQAGSEG